jgi:Na+/H+ antiporter NhaD/arsenite permease-like protein
MTNPSMIEEIIVVAIFVAGYAAIALEQRIGVSKAAIAVFMAFCCWIVALAEHFGRDQVLIAELDGSLLGVAQIVFYLIGAMAIVMIIDAHNGFWAITRLLRARSKAILLWKVALLSFLLSAVLDNVTTSIVMVTLLRRAVKAPEDRILLAGIVVIAANAGGAWTPIGDVTTSMLWIQGNVTSGPLIARLVLPSILSLVAPLIWLTPSMRGRLAELPAPEPGSPQTPADSTPVLLIGLGALILTPVLKSLLDLPPYLGTLAGLSILWIYTDLGHKTADEFRIPAILRRIDLSSILFFVGILLAVAALESSGALLALSRFVVGLFPNPASSIPVFGVLSSIVDNVPLTAAIIGMFDPAVYPPDTQLWLLTAFCVGTGGSLLIIGSAAGVMVMGLENLSFGVYLRRLTVPALVGYALGCGFLFLF